MTTLLEKHGVEKYPFGTEGELRVTAFELNTPQRSDVVTLILSAKHANQRMKSRA